MQQSSIKSEFKSCIDIIVIFKSSNSSCAFRIPPKAVLQLAYPGVANCEFAEATAMSQEATSWHPAAVARPVKR